LIKFKKMQTVLYCFQFTSLSI